MINYFKTLIQAMKVVTDLSRPDSHPFVRMSETMFLSIQKPVDSGMDSAELIAWGENVDFELSNQSKYTSACLILILIMNRNQKEYYMISVHEMNA